MNPSFAALARSIPRLRTVIQLTGLVVVAGCVVAVSAFKTDVIVSVPLAMIGVLILAFGLFLGPGLQHIDEPDRGKVVVQLFLMLCVLTVVLAGVAGTLVIVRQRTAQSVDGPSSEQAVRALHNRAKDVAIRYERWKGLQNRSAKALAAAELVRDAVSLAGELERTDTGLDDKAQVLKLSRLAQLYSFVGSVHLDASTPGADRKQAVKYADLAYARADLGVKLIDEVQRKADHGDSAARIVLKWASTPPSSRDTLRWYLAKALAQKAFVTRSAGDILVATAMIQEIAPLFPLTDSPEEDPQMKWVLGQESRAADTSFDRASIVPATAVAGRRGAAPSVAERYLSTESAPEASLSGRSRDDPPIKDPGPQRRTVAVGEDERSTGGGEDPPIKDSKQRDGAKDPPPKDP